MVLVAQIIVDVPLMQTDRPYSYLIPEAMQDQIALGMRVHVPFGKGNRLLQGFVIGLEEQEDLRDFPELKPIAELLDMSQSLIRINWTWLIRCDIRSFPIRFPS